MTKHHFQLGSALFAIAHPASEKPMSHAMILFETDLKTSISRTRWLLTAGFIAGAVAFVSAFYVVTISSAVDLWVSMDTYSYAFAVLPIAAFLVWMRREYFRASVPTPSLSALAVLLVFSSMWAVGQGADIQELKHFAFAGVVACIIVSVIGWGSAYHFMVPIGYLFLLAPVGTPLLPYLQDITTFLSTAFIRLGGIPLYVEGYFIEVATGKYEVAPGCAGLNFVLALATVAPLYCEIMYNGWAKKAIALATMMMLVPVFNGIRVFGIIAIAEYTGGAIDISADHLFYGWVFFSAVVLFMFFVGSLFADPPEPPAPTMPWGGNYTLAELLSDPIMIRARLVLLIAVFLSIFPVLLDEAGALG